MEAMSVDHLGPEAIAALVDGELSPRAAERAQLHLDECEECRREVNNQLSVALTVRNALHDQEHEAQEHSDSDRAVSVSLWERLAKIPESCSTSEDSAPALPSENFAIDGRRFPRTVGDQLDLAFHKLRNRGRPDVR